MNREESPPESAQRAGQPDRTRGITRRDLQMVIRRAAELYTSDADEDDRLTEEEVLRIADELGLPGRHVRQALFELPTARDRPAEGRITRWYGDPGIQGTRLVAGPPEQVLDRLEDYLVTREFLQVLRRQGPRATFTPAEDAISNVARAVRRPQRQWQIARSRRVHVEVRSISDAESHVRLELDMHDQRRSAIISGIAGGAILGLPLAAGVGLPVGHVIGDIAGDLAGWATAAAAGAGTLGASISGGLALARSRFHVRLDSARTEVAALLDRLQGGRKLDPPPAPWLRSLRSRIAGSLKG